MPNRSIDIALIAFNSDEAFNLSLLNYASTSIGEDCQFFNSIQREWQTCRPFTRTAGVSLPTGAVSVPILRVTDWNDLKPRVPGNKDAYELIYEASTVPGMSGGAIMGD